MLQNLPLKKEGSNPKGSIPILLCSALDPSTHSAVWKEIQSQAKLRKDSSTLSRKRGAQREQWFDDAFDENILLKTAHFKQKFKSSKLYQKMLAGEIPPPIVAKEIVNNILTSSST